MQATENEEDVRVRRAVNAAAYENQDPNETEIIADEMLPATIAPRDPPGPDLAIFIALDPEKGRYAYRLVDTNTNLSHYCVRVLPNADETALALLAVTNSLKSILKRYANGLLMARCGFASRADAVASGWRLKVELVVTNPDLASLGQIVTAIEDSFDSLPENERRVWQMVKSETRRFDVRWRHIEPTDPIITGLTKWADTVFSRSAHNAQHHPHNPTRTTHDKAERLYEPQERTTHIYRHTTDDGSHHN